MKEARTIEILMKLMNWTEEEVREKLNGPAGKFYVSQAELYESMIRSIEHGDDPFKALENSSEPVLDTRKDFTEQQKNDIRREVYQSNSKVYKRR